MKTELEQQDIEAIAQRVIELVRPLIGGNDRHDSDDSYMTVKQASSYIGLSVQWIHNNLKDIPHLNLGNKPLFKKSEIDQYLEQFRKKTLQEILNQKLTESFPMKKNKQVLKTGAFKNQESVTSI